MQSEPQMLPPQLAQRLLVHCENDAVRQREGEISPEALLHDLLRKFLVGALLRLAFLRQLQGHELKGSEAAPFRT